MGMKILVVGSGGREHALVWKIAQSPLVKRIYCAPGNAGIARLAECVPIASENLQELTTFARDRKIDLVVIGPEMPLVAGLSDLLRAKGIPVFGPSRLAAELEGSKAFMKDILARHDIPTARYQVFRDVQEARHHLRYHGAPVVVKASGLAAGKGAMVCKTLDQAEEALDRIMVKREFGDAGDVVVLEDLLPGEEASFIALVDGENILPLAGSQDHKAVGDGDTGPNTGGMGAYSPAPVLSKEIHKQVMQRIMTPVVKAMAKEGRPYRGVLYAGLMIHQGKARTLEFNTRFGDPETQPILMRMTSDLVPLLMACATGSLARMEVTWDPRPALCVVMAAGGYPGSYRKGTVIHGLEDAASLPDVQVFHAGTRLDGESVVTAGGRVLGVTALGTDIAAAQAKAYAAVAKISWQDVQYRRDIGYRACTRMMQEDS